MGYIVRYLYIDGKSGSGQIVTEPFSSREAAEQYANHLDSGGEITEATLQHLKNLGHGTRRYEIEEVEVLETA